VGDGVSPVNVGRGVSGIVGALVDLILGAVVDLLGVGASVGGSV
jgi:hypothetical protein